MLFTYAEATFSSLCEGSRYCDMARQVFRQKELIYDLNRRKYQVIMRRILVSLCDLSPAAYYSL